jgi:hypothetical protein
MSVGDVRRPSLGFGPDGHVLVGAGQVSRWTGGSSLALYLDCFFQ